MGIRNRPGGNQEVKIPLGYRDSDGRLRTAMISKLEEHERNCG